MWEEIIAKDQQLFGFINSSWLSQYDTFWNYASRIEYWIPMYFLFFYLLYKKVPKPANYGAMLSVPLIALVTLQLTNLVKNHVARLRPNNEPLLIDTINVSQQPQNFSFWSGHSAVSFAVSVFVFTILRKQGSTIWYYLFFIWPLIFAFSRIFNGVHYPLDVVVGSLVGIILGRVAACQYLKLRTKSQHTT